MSGIPFQGEVEPYTFELARPEEAGPFVPPHPDDTGILELTMSDETATFELPSLQEFMRAEPSGAERREKPRQVIRVQARICPAGDEPLDVHTVDLSSHGLAITSARALNLEQECNVEIGISVPELASPPSLRASVRYCARLHDGQFRIGLKFTSVSIEAAELIVAALGL